MEEALEREMGMDRSDGPAGEQTLEGMQAESQFAQAASAPAAGRSEAFGRAAASLLRGVVQRYKDESLWQEMLRERAQLGDYFGRIGLRLIVQELDEYAYLQQIEESGLPRLVPRRPLSYGLSLLLVELRKAMGEFDGTAGERLIVDAASMSEQLAPFFPPMGNEMKYRQRVEGYLRQAEEMGFLRALPKGKGYEVRPLLRSFIDAQWLADFAEKLKGYEEYGRRLSSGGEQKSEQEGALLEGTDVPDTGIEAEAEEGEEAQD